MIIIKTIHLLSSSWIYFRIQKMLTN